MVTFRVSDESRLPRTTYLSVEVSYKPNPDVIVR